MSRQARTIPRTRASEQCATAQGSTKPTSSTAAPVQDATASLEETTCEYDDDDDDGSDEVSGQDWITRFQKGGHDLLWSNGPVSSACPTLLTV